MSKRVFLVRHPSVLYDPALLRKAEKDGLDIETYLSLDLDGWKMIPYLGEYLSNFDSRDRTVIVSSHLRRSVETAVELCWRFRDWDWLISSDFTEVPLNCSADRMESFVQLARVEGRADAFCMYYWFTLLKPELIFDAAAERLARALQFLNGISAENIVVITHRLFIAAVLHRRDIWAREIDLDRIMRTARKIANCSVTELTELSVKPIVTSHLPPELIKGIF